jgi:hypothetical protein
MLIRKASLEELLFRIQKQFKPPVSLRTIPNYIFSSLSQAEFGEFLALGHSRMQLVRRMFG